MNRAKKIIINNIKKTYCRIKPSKLEGVGVFAIRDIPKGQKIFWGVGRHKWYTFKISDFCDCNKEVLKMIDDFFVIEKNGAITIPEFGLDGIGISFFLNNSKKPNVKTIDGGENFATLRKIKKGEELAVAYKTYDDKYKR
ncbi:MAG: SET domain-containing protein [Patescibacteria group bacterium]